MERALLNKFKLMIWILLSILIIILILSSKPAPTWARFHTGGGRASITRPMSCYRAYDLSHVYVMVIRIRPTARARKHVGFIFMLAEFYLCKLYFCESCLKILYYNDRISSMFEVAAIKTHKWFNKNVTLWNKPC